MGNIWPYAWFNAYDFMQPYCWMYWYSANHPKTKIQNQIKSTTTYLESVFKVLLFSALQHPKNFYR